MAMISRSSGVMLGAALLFGAAGASAADPAKHAAAMAAADAAAAPVPTVPAGTPVCVNPPPSGEKLAGDMKLVAEGHAIDFANGGGGDALVKIRHADSGKLAASFYLRSREEMTIEGVPDGKYITQYAFGPALAPDCKSFVRIIKANQMPDSDDLRTIVTESRDLTEVKRMSVSYELSVSETANTKPVSIDAAAFNAD